MQFQQNKKKDMTKKQDKISKREQYRAVNEPPRLTLAEEIGNSMTHGFGAALAVAGIILLLLKSDSELKIMASCFYGISLIFMMLMSCLYHAYKSGTALKRLWRTFDYTSIYLLIGGTFAPFFLVDWGNTLGIVLFCVQWALILLGITIVAVFGPGRWKGLHYAIYFIIGSSGIMFMPGWYVHNRPLFICILTGGIIYTAGMVPFALHRKYSHFIWHFFVLAAALFHWLGIYFFIF